MSVKTIAINTDWGQDSTSVTKSNPSGRIRLTEQPTFSSHRSGWAYAISSIAELHNDDGVNFYGFVENEFAWRKDEELAKGNIPFKNKWVGFLHNPVNGPWWFGPRTHLYHIYILMSSEKAYTNAGAYFVYRTITLTL